jgi:hypothetical protein
MEWLNDHHLFYFWTVAGDGSFAKASEHSVSLRRPSANRSVALKTEL